MKADPLGGGVLRHHPFQRFVGGDAAGKDTVQRTFRFDKAAGIVSDEVEELKIHPANWGDLQF